MTEFFQEIHGHNPKINSRNAKKFRDLIRRSLWYHYRITPEEMKRNRHIAAMKKGYFYDGRAYTLHP